MRQRAIPSFVLLLISLGLSGCATKDTILPRDGKPMQDIYWDHLREMKRNDLSDVRSSIQVDIVEDEASNQLGTLNSGGDIASAFPSLPNPTMYLYVYPHLAGAERHPVPGYITQFKLYERDEIALPGEDSP
jgi:conjugative transfer region lipoprotein (TIGR03751 family)